MVYLYLFLAIVAEVIATTALKATQQFSRPGPTIIVFAGYIAAFYLLTLVLRSIPVGIAYAVWAGVGMVLIVLAGAVVYRQIPDLPAIVGIILIIAGVVVIHSLSNTARL
jgi:small multidrug resistance pump